MSGKPVEPVKKDNILESLQRALDQARDTKYFLLGKDVIQNIATVFEESFGPQPVVIVADETTYRVAGETVSHILAARLAAPPIIFGAEPPLYADYKNVLALVERLRPVEAVPLVIGSGTLNDLTKLASHQLGRPYMVVATAASMDGYTAFGAAIARDGFKQTMGCPAPRAVLADLQVLATAPTRMNATGYGDLLGKVTAGADWIIADALEVEAIEPFAWSLVQDSLNQWLGQPAQLHAGESSAIEGLFDGLIMSGLAMQTTQTSRPASGSEHQFSHLWEMEAIAFGRSEYPHGFKVGIGSLASAALYEQILAHDLTQLDIDTLCANWPSPTQLEQAVRATFKSPQMVEKAVEESLAKHLTPEQLRQRLTMLAVHWPSIREELAAQLKTASQLRQQLLQAGCPIRPEQLDLSLADMRASYFKARLIRRRYTILDLAFETGLLDQCVDNLFQPDGFWGSVNTGS